MSSILVVEDDEILNEVICYNLVRAGYSVLTARDGNDAITLLQSNAIDLVLLDVMLPGATGWEISAWIEKHLPTPIVFFTAKGSREDFDTARRFRNFAGYFVKPYATADVLRHVEKVLAASA